MSLASSASCLSCSSARKRAVLTEKQRSESSPPPCTERPGLECIAATRRNAGGKKGSGGGPCLFPSTPLWLKDCQGFVECFAPEYAALIQHMLSSMSQRKMDLRWQSIIETARENGASDAAKPAFTWENLVMLFRANGYIVSDAPPSRGSKPDKLYSINDVMRSGGAALDEDYDDDNLAVVARCDACGCIIDLADPPECICGTSFCSAKCFLKAAANHKNECSMIRENNELACGLTETYWRLVVDGKIVWPYAAENSCA